MQTRILYLDLLRFLATLAVIMLHVSATAMGITINKIDFSFCLAYDVVCRWCVPAFVMISGSLFLNPAKQVPISVLYKKYILRLVVALVSWWVLYLWVLEPGLHIIKHVPYNLIGFEEAFTNPFDIPYHLWFLPMIIGLYLVMPILKVIVSNEKVVNYFLVLWFVMSVLLSIPVDYTFGFFDRFQVKMVVGFSGYMILGYKLSKSDHRYNAVVLAFLLLIVFLITFFAVVNGLNINIVGNAHNPLMIIMSTLVFLGMKRMNVRVVKEGCLEKLIGCVRNDLFGVYLIHLFYLKLFFRPHFYGSMPFGLSVPLFTVVVFVASVFTIKVLRRIPVIRYICS